MHMLSSSGGRFLCLYLSVREMIYAHDRMGQWHH